MFKRTKIRSIIASFASLILVTVLALPATSMAATPLSLFSPELSSAVQNGPQVSLQWSFTSILRISGYEIERSLEPLSGFAKIMSVGSKDLNATDPTVEHGKGYYYRVRAYKNGKTMDYSKFSNVVFADVLPIVIIPPPDSTLPTVSLTSPASSTQITSDQTLAVVAAAQDNVGVNKVEFFDGSVLKATDTTAPYSYNWAITSADNGSHSLTAKAFDAAGNVATSAAASVAVNIAAQLPKPGAFEFAFSNYSVNEGAGKIDITIKRVDGSDGAASVDFRTRTFNGLGTADWASDYGTLDWTPINFASGETSKVVSVTIKEDSVVEGDEWFTIQLGNPTGGATLGLLVQSTVTIKDNDVAVPVPGAFEFSAVTYTVDESAGKIDITIKRVGGSDGAASVDFRTRTFNGLGTADWASDYGTIDWTPINFASGETSKVVSVTIHADAKTEGDEWFTIQLGNPTGGATLGSGSNSTVTIIDAAVSAPPVDLGPLKIFPGAEGYGTNSPAGRGGATIHVTNLNAYGPGSLRAALEATGPRTVVFDVSGTIDLTYGPSGTTKGEAITIRSPFLTVAGQTAPAPGIQVKGGTIIIYTHDVLIQHLSFRVGDNPMSFGPVSAKALFVSGWGDTYNVVIDHVTASWGVDDCITTWPGSSGLSPVTDVTISNSLISEGLHNSIVSLQANDSKGLLIGDNTKRIAVLRNIFAHNNGRNPVSKGGVTGAIVNNLVYNHGTRDAMPVGSDGPNDGANAESFIGNVIKSGRNTTKFYGITVGGSVKAGTKIYQTDNVFPGGGAYNDWTNVSTVNAPPVSISGITILPSSQVETTLLQTAGSRPAQRDAADNRVIADIKNVTGTIIDSQEQVSSWPYLSANYRPFIAPANPNGDDNGNGFTNLEEVLYQMARQVEGR